MKKLYIKSLDDNNEFHNLYLKKIKGCREVTENDINNNYLLNIQNYDIYTYGNFIKIVNNKKEYKVILKDNIAYIRD